MNGDGNDRRTKPLREGFSTGTAVSAAAFAAVRLLCDAPLPESVAVALPPFSEDGLPRPVACPPARLPVPIEYGKKEDGTAFASVIKDGGDDPDVTHGARLIVHASVIPFPLRAARGARTACGTAAENPHNERGRAPFPPVAPCRPLLPETAGRQYARPIALSLPSRTITLYGGVGVGTVTLPGLPAAVGEPAINPVPRRQIAFAALEAANGAGYAGPLHLLLSAPEGEALARRTLNARLGIVGGLSILGVSGTVRPYSHDAWRCAVRQGLDVAAALHLPAVILSTGRRSERLAFALYPDLPAQAGVQVADYAAFALREAAGRPFARILWACFPGKLLKLAQGLEWTHAAMAPTDMDMLADLCRQAGCPHDLSAAVRGFPTASGALARIGESDARLGETVLNRLARAALDRMRAWLRAGAVERTRGGAAPELILHVFSLNERLLLRIAAPC
jgi:cobalt-precorrin-5B (C1)-methyltransferase